MPKKKLIKRRKKAVSFRDGAEGMIEWCEQFVHIPIYPEGSDIPEYVLMGELPDTPDPQTGRSYRGMWNSQKVLLREALRMKNGRFVYRLIVFCWMRGEGKSFLACLIQLWRFFCFPKQQIMLGANSKDQIKFVHFDIMLNIIMHSPELLKAVGGETELKQKEIRIRKGKEILSVIRPISSFTGILSNISGYTFSEMFLMKNPSFFTQIDGSIRNVPNALGVIDSTVSDKQHVLYSLYYNSVLQKKTKTVFFSYRYSRGPDGDVNDYWHPMQTEEQLADYKVKFPFGEFERYFLNLWEAGQVTVFTEEMIKEIFIFGANEGKINHKEISVVLNQRREVVNAIDDMTNKGLGNEVDDLYEKVKVLDSQLTPMDDKYKLIDPYGTPQAATIDDLVNIGDMLDTNWAVMAGSDFGDPFAVRGLARTMVSVIAKGLPGSRTNPDLYLRQSASPQYVYLMLVLARIKDHSLNVVKQILDKAHEDYEGIYTYCSERYGNWDIATWCDDRDITFTPIFPSYDRQKESFKGMHEAIKEGRFKSATIGVHGSKKENVIEEELSVFMHDMDKRWFGSPQKMEKYGIQDDAIFSIGWCMFGGKELGVDEFRLRKSSQNFGFHQENTAILGNYQ
jgi:hypothetical protein